METIETIKLDGGGMFTMIFLIAVSAIIILSVVLIVFILRGQNGHSNWIYTGLNKIIP